MAVITKISVQKKNKERYSIFIDKGNGEEYGFSVDEGVLITFGLRKGIEIDEEKIKSVLYEDQIKKAYNQAIVFLSYRLRSLKEVDLYLATKEHERNIINEVGARLIAHGYINDLEFANAFVRTRICTSDKGPLLIERELKEKGVSAHYIETALQQYTYDLQTEKVKTLLEKQQKKYIKDSFQIRKQKLNAFIASKGFSFDCLEFVRQQKETDVDEQQEEEAFLYQFEKAKRKFQRYEGREYNDKMKQWLYRKGFPISKINNYLNNDNGLQQ
ncbi:recombination regulator RecX [Bacillus alkalicellulosilyticus]|uniref:recombination regulator RecX n=1 Tax=Alkalihalobacterium alkalicellulosilyticum TaxID=1912214 RepID=UPI000996164D|nr:recombination regulator RecX [Bacillus alkalicellulosilyticus]